MARARQLAGCCGGWDRPRPMLGRGGRGGQPTLTIRRRATGAASRPLPVAGLHRVLRGAQEAPRPLLDVRGLWPDAVVLRPAHGGQGGREELAPRRGDNAHDHGTRLGPALVRRLRHACCFACCIECRIECRIAHHTHTAHHTLRRTPHRTLHCTLHRAPHRTRHRTPHRKLHRTLCIARRIAGATLAPSSSSSE